MGALIDFCNEYHDFTLKNTKLPADVTQVYDLTACLKQTESSQVFLLRAKADSHRYILKRVLKQYSDALEEEYILHRSLVHQGLISAVKYFEDDLYGYLIREYVEGNTITELVEMMQEGFLTDHRIIDITLQLCSILGYLHQQKPPIIHRDIKSDNIIVTKEGLCKLIDFGIARRFQREQNKDTVIMGTKYYAPPEQYGFYQTDARSDIYSIGVLMFYMATGSSDISEMNQYPIRKEIRNCITRCTEFSPENRFKNVAQLKKKLLKLNIRSRRNLHIKKELVGGAVIALLFAALLIYKNQLSGQLDQTGQEDAGQDDAIKSSAITSGHNETGAAGGISDTKAAVLDVNSQYVFQSELIEQAVRKKLNKASSDIITYGDLDNVSELYICGKQIYDNWDEHFVYGISQYMSDKKYTDSLLYDQQGDITSLEDLANMKNLQILALYKQSIVDISPLKDLENLKKLGLGTNQISDLAPLKNLSGLTLLDMSGNPISNDDMNEIIELPQLEELDVGETNIINLDVINKMKLKALSLYNDKLLECDGIQEMTTLKRLIISGVNISVTREELYNICELSGLEELRIMGGDTFDISMLTGLRSLTYLDLCGNQVEDLSGLAGMKLTNLMLNLTQTSDLSFLEDIPTIRILEIRNIPCDDYAPLKSLPDLNILICDSAQEIEIKKQLGEVSFQLMIPDYGK